MVMRLVCTTHFRLGAGANRIIAEHVASAGWYRGGEAERDGANGQVHDTNWIG